MTQWGLDTLFNPAKRHMDEEKRRLQSTREEIGDSSGGKRIDLESGKVTIRKETPANGADAEAAEQQDDTRTRRKPKPAPSAAAIRAAERRGRRPR
jgi:Family of unknown function (DUF6191)